MNGHVAAVGVLLKAGADVDARDDDGRTALRGAVSKGHVSVVKALLKVGAGIELSDKHGLTALHVAALEGWVAAVRVLLKAGADIDARDDDGWVTFCSFRRTTRDHQGIAKGWRRCLSSR